MTLIPEIESTEWSISLAGYGEIAEGLDDVNQCLRILLFTRKGEVPFYPEFGCGIFDFLDQPLTTGIPAMIKTIIEAVELYEPRVIITKITPANSEPGTVTFTVYYKFSDAVDTGQIDVTYGLT